MTGHVGIFFRNKAEDVMALLDLESQVQLPRLISFYKRQRQP
jgi:hypothetical protein